MNRALSEPPPADAGLFGLDIDPTEAEIVVVGVPWEPTVSYGRGTSRTPRAIIPASHQLDFFDPFLNRNFAEQVAMAPCEPDWEARNARCIELAKPILAAGGAVTPELAARQAEINRDSAELNRALRRTAGTWLDRGKIVGALGGDHASPLGLILACAERSEGLGILHIDAHHDLREAYEGFVYSHASIMYNALREAPNLGRLVSVGIRDFSAEERDLAQKDERVRTFYNRDLKRALFAGESWAALARKIVEALPRQVYVSFDVDGLDPKLCPHTGTPVPGGLDFDQACFLLEETVASGRRIVGFDLCEAAPNLQDPEDEWDLNVAARLLHKLCAAAWASRQELP